MIQFGQKENGRAYIDRIGAYGLITDNNLIAVVKIPIGYFLPGGGVDRGEDYKSALKREISEEIGYDCSVQDKIATASQHIYSPIKKLYLNKIEHYYKVELTEIKAEESEEDHSLIWLELEKAAELLFEEAQRWAVKQILKRR